MKLIALVLLLVPFAVRAEPSVYGFTLPVWTRDGYDSPEAQKSVANMAATGAKWIAVVPTWYMDDAKSSLIVQAPQKTASDDSVVRLIRLAHGLGLHVVLKPHVNTLTGTPTAKIAPRDERLWFEQYHSFLMSYARIARDEHVELFVVGTELMSMTRGHGKQWKALIKDTRAIYPGKVTYAANWYDFPLMPFWGDLDFVGVDAYFPLLGGHHPLGLEASWQPYVGLLQATARAHGKPLLFTEIGVSSVKGGSRKPWDYRTTGPADMAEMTAFYKAFVKVFKHERNFAGFLQWCWDVNPNAGGPNDTTMTLQGKPALGILSQWFAELNRVPPPPKKLDLSGPEKRIGAMLGGLKSALP